MSDTSKIITSDSVMSVVADSVRHVVKFFLIIIFSFFSRGGPTVYLQFILPIGRNYVSRVDTH